MRLTNARAYKIIKSERQVAYYESKNVESRKRLYVEKLAELSGVNYMKIHYIERGKVDAKNIRLETALKLSRALNCRPEELLDEVSSHACL